MTRYAFALIASLLFCACDFNVLAVEVESDEVCVTGLSADIPADANGSVTVTLSKDEGQPEGDGGAFDIEVPEGWTVTEVTLLGVGIEALGGVDNLHFIDTVQLAMSGEHPDMDLPTIELLNVELADLPYNTSSSTTTFLEAHGNYNLVDYLEADSLEFDLGMTGTMPDNDWKLGIDVCFTFVAEYRENI